MPGATAKSSANSSGASDGRMSGLPRKLTQAHTRDVRRDGPTAVASICNKIRALCDPVRVVPTELLLLRWPSSRRSRESPVCVLG